MSVMLGVPDALTGHGFVLATSDSALCRLDIEGVVGLARSATTLMKFDLWYAREAHCARLGNLARCSKAPA